jgi:adenylate cyclase
MRKQRMRVAQRALDVALEAVPGSIVERVTSAGAPLTRYSGRTRAGTTALASALSALAQPPRRRHRRDEAVSLDEIAMELGRTTQEVERWAAAGMLGEPRDGDTWSHEAVDRAALIVFALRRGSSEEELEEAAREGRLPLLALERSLAGNADLSAREVAEKSDVPLDTALAIWRALGLPIGDVDQLQFTRNEVFALRVLAAMRSVFTDEDLVEAASVVGRAMAEISAASTELFRRRLTSRYVEAGLDDLEISLRLAAIADLMVPPLGPVLEVVLRHHLAAATSAEAALRLDEAGTLLTGAQRELSVGFADLVGFTSASERLSALEVAELASRLLRAAEAVLVPHGVRIVKSIGDAVMFTARDPATACRAACDLIAAAKQDGRLPAVRAGIAHGPVLRAYADYFGRTVNMAARLCDVAGPGEVLLYAPDGDSGEGLENTGLSIEQTRKVTLKGIQGPVAAVRVNCAR